VLGDYTQTSSGVRTPKTDNGRPTHTLIGCTKSHAVPYNPVFRKPDSGHTNCPGNTACGHFLHKDFLFCDTPLKIYIQEVEIRGDGRTVREGTPPEFHEFCLSLLFQGGPKDTLKKRRVETEDKSVWIEMSSTIKRDAEDPHYTSDPHDDNQSRKKPRRAAQACDRCKSRKIKVLTPSQQWLHHIPRSELSSIGLYI
jgi:hypothetical protein